MRRAFAAAPLRYYSRTVRIAIDARKLHDFGVGTYVRNLVTQLAQLDRDSEYVLLCRKEDLGLAARLGPNFRAVTDPSGHYSFSEQITIPYHVHRIRPDVFHTPHYVLPIFTPCPSITTIHDCIHLVFPQYLQNRLAHAYARAAFYSATRRARRILTVSETSKRDILRFFRIPPERVTVIYNAIAETFYQPPPADAVERVRERYQLNHRFVMYAGNVKPHKNLERLIDAFRQVRAVGGYDDLTLLVSGSEISKYATLRRAVHRSNLHQHVRFLGYQPEETLAVLYRLADVFVFPSLYEGFGLPPLEAMASGTPVVVSNVSSLPEVVGDAGLLVNPYDAESVAGGIRRVLDNAELRRDLIARGVARARTFSWRASIARVHAIYAEVASGS